MFQLLCYIVRIWEQRLRDRLPLCPIVPLVVYHGQGGWTAARSLRELLQSPPGLEAYQVDLLLPLLDLSKMSDEELAGEPILRSTLRLLKYSRSQQLLAKLVEIVETMVQSLDPDRLPE